MPKMQEVGTINAQPVVSGPSFGIPSGAGAVVRQTDAAVANGNAMLISELEKRDTFLREPLKSVTYPRDIPIKVGGGWAETVSAINIDYGVAGGSGDSLVLAPGANDPKVIQANLEKDVFRTHIYSIVMRIMFVDMHREAFTGRSLEEMLTRGVRLSYDKHMDQNTYIGMPQYDTYGLINNPLVTATNVATGASGNTAWSSKTPDEILTDINDAILDGWGAGEYDLSAIPNHILLPYAQYNYIATARVSELAEKTILTFLLENNVANKNGGNLVIGATQYCAGAGAGNTDRMVAYVNNDRFLAMEELVPMHRHTTLPNIDTLSYDSVFFANISEVEIFYDQPIRYYDGI